jgi:hypothetical protein
MSDWGANAAAMAGHLIGLNTFAYLPTISPASDSASTQNAVPALAM